MSINPKNPLIPKDATIEAAKQAADALLDPAQTPHLPSSFRPVRAKVKENEEIVLQFSTPETAHAFQEAMLGQCGRASCLKRGVSCAPHYMFANGDDTVTVRRADSLARVATAFSDTDSIAAQTDRDRLLTTMQQTLQGQQI